MEIKKIDFKTALNIALYLKENNYPNIDIFLEKLKPKFKVGDIITITEGEIEGYSLKIEYFEEEDGVMYAMWTRDMNEQIRGACFDYIRLATNEEIIQYYSEQGWVKNAHALYNGHNVTIINIFISNDNVFVNHSLGTTSILYEGLRLLTNDEIIKYYGDLGWIKGAKFKTKKGTIDTVESLKILGNVQVHGLQYADNISNCELIKEPNYPKDLGDVPKLQLLKAHQQQHFLVASNYNQFNSIIAFSHLSILHKAMIDEYNKFNNCDWKPDWNRGQENWIIERLKNELSIDCNYTIFHHLAFPNKELAEFSLLHHKDLWEQYFQL